MFDFDALNPAFEDREPFIDGYFEDEDDIFALPNDFDDEEDDGDLEACIEELEEALEFDREFDLGYDDGYNY